MPQLASAGILYLLSVLVLLALQVPVNAQESKPDTPAQPDTGAQTSTSTSDPPETKPTTTEAKPNKGDEDAAEKKARDSEFAKGSQLFQKKKFAEAIKHLQKAASSTADDGEAKILLGYAHYNLKQYDAALKQYHLASEKGTLVSIRNRAGKLERTLSCYMRGVCPGNCLKPSMPGWRKMNVPGKPAHLVWMVYPYLDPAGKGGSEYWSNDHMGEVIEYVNGRPFNKGKCPTCQGTGKVSLPK